MSTETLLAQKNTRTKLLTAIALTLIIGLGAFLRLYELGAHSIGNTYYAATVKSMLTSWSNFFFGAFEPGGSVTVDKPPLGFWVQSVSAALLGVNGFSLALPNALAGIGSIALVYYLVKEQFNRGAGLVAALTLAVVPVTISTERNNTIDGLLVFVLLLAVWAVWKSVQSGKFRYLLLGAFIVGLGFNIKMLQAYMIIPAIYALYFFGAKEGWWTKIWHLGVSTLLLVAVSLSWAIAVDLVPEENRPFIGSSEDNTVMELIIGHNGLSRLGLNDNKRKDGDGGNQPQPPVDDGQRAQASNTPNQLSDQTPVNGIPSNRQPPQEALDACLNLDVGDACTVNLPNRDVDGICISPQQLDTLVCAPNERAPAPNGQIAGNAPVGGPNNGGQPDGRRPNGGGAFNTSETGQAGLFRLFSEPLVTEASWVLPLALVSILLTAITLGFSWSKKHLALILWTLWLLPALAYFSFTTGLFHRYYLIMLGPALAALTGMAFWSVSELFKRSRWLGFNSLVSLVVITLGFQAVMLSEYSTASWLLPFAIVVTLIGLGILLVNKSSQMKTVALAIVLLAILAAPFTWSVMATANENANVALPTATINDAQPTTFMTPDNTVMSDNEEAIMNYLLANTDPDSYLLATVNARSAAPYILETGRAVLTFGGFSGGDQVIDAAGVAEMIENGELRYILYSEKITNSHRDIAAWVRESCVPTSVPGVEARQQNPAQAQNTQNVRMGPPSENEVLYDCAQ
jgi:4-amino-4-deoxy-L-arabinose transferase-like glycosyltransferase